MEAKDTVMTTKQTEELIITLQQIMNLLQRIENRLSDIQYNTATLRK